MCQHHEHRAVQSCLGEAENSKDNEAEVTDGRIRDQLLHIRLHHSDQRAIDNPNQREHHNPRSICSGLFREQAEIEAQHSIRAHL